jgi:hypothetical protein
MSYTAAVTAKGRFLVAALCLVAVLAAASAPLAGDPAPAVLVVVAALPWAQLAVDPTDPDVAVPVETLLAGRLLARGPPLV